MARLTADVGRLLTLGAPDLRYRHEMQQQNHMADSPASDVLLLSAAVEVKLSRLSARHGQVVDRAARHELQRAGELLSLRALEKTEKIFNAIHSLSAYVTAMVKRVKDEAFTSGSPVPSDCSPSGVFWGKQNSHSIARPVNSPRSQQESVCHPEATNKSELNKLLRTITDVETYDENFLNDLAEQEEKSSPWRSPARHFQRNSITEKEEEDPCFFTKQPLQISMDKTEQAFTYSAPTDDPLTPQSPEANASLQKRKIGGWGDRVHTRRSRFGEAQMPEEFIDGIGGERVSRRLDLHNEEAFSLGAELLGGQVQVGSSICPMSLEQMYGKWMVQQGKDASSPVYMDHIQALGELSREKALLVMCCFSEGGWEEALTVDEIKKYKDMPIEEVDGRLHQAYSIHKTSCNRVAKIDWSKKENNYMVFHCEVSRNGWCTFKGPIFERGGSPLQRIFGDGGVLRVHFADCNGDLDAEGHYRRIAREGIYVGLRHYEFYAYKDPKMKKKQGLVDNITSAPRCFFICTCSYARDDCENPRRLQFRNIHEARYYIMHINNVQTLSKKFSRLQLALSQTLPVLDLDDSRIKVDIIEDILCTDSNGEVVRDSSDEPLIHTDGTGFVSCDIASLCPSDVFKGTKQSSSDRHEEYPLLMQVRIFYKGGVSKGTLLVNLKLPPFTIQIRRSMLKVKPDEKSAAPSFNSLELCNTSRKPGNAKLFQHLVLLLVLGGVSEDIILRFAREALEDINTTFKDRNAAIAAVSKSTGQGDFTNIALRMLLCGIPLNEVYLHKTMWDMCKGRFQDLSKARVPVRDTFNLMGCADPTGKLERNQVVIVLDNGPVYGTKVLVYKPPGLHPGDIHIFEATWFKEFEDIIGRGKYGIFFPTKGPRSVVDEIANSDLDGDQYWVCLNPELVKNFNQSDVWQRPSKKNPQPTARNTEDFDRLQFENFLTARFRPSTAMGVAANSWLAHMDRFLSLPKDDKERPEIQHKIQSLVDTYYDAVDAEKSGEQVFVKEHDKAKRWPHFMERLPAGKWIVEEKNYYSTTILGKIYDLVKRVCHSDDFSWEPPGEIIMERKFQCQGFSEQHRIWEQHYLDYRHKVSLSLQDSESEDRNAMVEAILQEYRWEFYKADSFSQSEEPLDDLCKKASAIYAVVYTAAQKKMESLESDLKGQRKPRFGLQFAWRVAGLVLCRMYIAYDKEDPIIVSETILKEMKLVRREK